ncbi:hypothetical protein Lesp02_23050 [Lentzea sp. NBRC 105346]|nr:hypothetical protein Lesp02_23050 [Lentzea sp. NBRC 105346]
MSHRCRKVSLSSILARWRSRWESASPPEGDGSDRRCDPAMVVRVGPGCVALEGTSFGPVYLSPLQVGRLRAALKTAAAQLPLDELALEPVARWS